MVAAALEEDGEDEGGPVPLGVRADVDAAAAAEERALARGILEGQKDQEAMQEHHSLARSLARTIDCVSICAFGSFVRASAQKEKLSQFVLSSSSIYLAGKKKKRKVEKKKQANRTDHYQKDDDVKVSE